MKLPIALALAWPERLPGAARACDWTRAARWEFEPLDEGAFPAVALCKRAGLRGRTAPAVLNAANEECVAAFLAGRLPFLSIVDTVDAVLREHEDSLDRDADSSSDSAGNALSVADVLLAESWARERAHALTDVVANRS